MNKTPIEWALNPDGSQGYTWNPITGCLNGCAYCYARKLANTRLKERYLANTNVADATRRLHDPNSSLWDRVTTDPFYPRFWKSRFWDVCAKQKPSGIFVCDMGELFGDWIPFEWQDRIFDIIKTCPQHRFYLLTKQPQNLAKFSPFPDNCWVGVTATNHLQAIKGMNYFKDVQAKIKFMSFEPLLADIGFSDTRWFKANQIIKSLDWLIIGALTGTKQELLSLKAAASLTLMPYGKKWTAQPKIEWVQEIVQAADKAGIPVFLKKNLNSENLPTNAFGKEGLVRREMP
ncbi:hypothetical protein LCGC14_1844400 [marine sediment metagenome]|uniref:DUF5131 family protein n=1 Tax=marine sediment metagenome TaxID=412755 RepID=A0A0F9JBJ7_9ZZZZ